MVFTLVFPEIPEIPTLISPVIAPPVAEFPISVKMPPFVPVTSTLTVPVILSVFVCPPP